MSEQLRAAK